MEQGSDLIPLFCSYQSDERWFAMKLRQCPRRRTESETSATPPFFALDIINVPPVKETLHLNWNQWLIRSIRHTGTCLTRFFVLDGKSQRLLTVLNEHLCSFTLLWSHCDMKPAVVSVTVSADGLEMWHPDYNKRTFPGWNYSAGSNQMGSFVFFRIKPPALLFLGSRKRNLQHLCAEHQHLFGLSAAVWHKSVTIQKCQPGDLYTCTPVHPKVGCLLIHYTKIELPGCQSGCQAALFILFRPWSASIQPYWLS